MYLLIVFLPFLSACLAGLFGRFLGSQGSAQLTTRIMLIVFIFSTHIFYEVSFCKCFVYINLATWINSEELAVSWGFMFDNLTVLMCLIVTFISFLVHLYSIEYMHHDPHFSRFMSYLSLFTFFMLILVTADNFLQMFVGWEGVGLCSYLLINFWFTRIQANKAAIKAMLINRIGDFFILLGIFAISLNFKTVDYSTVLALSYLFETKYIFLGSHKCHILTFISSCLFLGAMGKSAQIGLHSWLPDAMEGPTPVSALIHAATMVTAGVFLIVRSSFLFESSPSTLTIVTSLGAITAFFASTTGLVQNDLKRVIAYSTCSQLGYMIFACGVSNYSVGVFHLSNHAFFKALLFLGAGSVIHSVNDEQDMRKMGGLRNFLPFTYSAIVIGSLALAGFPFLSGFYSKDLILEVSLNKFNCLGYFSYSLGVISAFFTSFYSIRLICLTFLNSPRGFRIILCYLADSGTPIKVALGCLTIPSVFVGYISRDLLVGFGSPFFSNIIFLNSLYFIYFDSEFSITPIIKVLPLLMSLIGGVSSFVLYTFYSHLLFQIKVSNYGRFCFNFLNKKWFFDKIYNEFIGQFFFRIGYSFSYKLVDRGVFEMVGPTGLFKVVSKISYYIVSFNSGNLYHYNLVLVFGFVFLLVGRIILNEISITLVAYSVVLFFFFLCCVLEYLYLKGIN